MTDLLQAAKNLRAAQRAYMADRGNETLGRAVADRARELDDAIEAAEAPVESLGREHGDGTP